MPRQLAIELTSGEARALLLAVSESHITVEKSLVVPLTAEEKGDDAANRTVEETVAGALLENGITRVETLAVVGRADIELRLLTVPPAPEEELPSLVRFQASHELPNFDASTLLDYLPLEENSEQPRRVLAAVLKRGVKERLEKICRNAKLTLTHIVLRSAASASLMLRQKPELRSTCCLLVEILGRQVELTAVNGGRVVFLRHMLLSADPTDSPEAADNLTSEIRRTRVVVANQEKVDVVAPLLLIGQGEARCLLADRLRTTVDTEVSLVDPLPESIVAEPATSISPQDRDYCAALVGAVADEAAGRPHALDFLNPRQPPKTPSRRNTYVVTGLAVVALVFALVVFREIQSANLKKEVIRLQNIRAEQKPKIEEGEKIIEASEQVETWVRGEVAWLEELRWLSEQFPPAEEATLKKLNAFGDDRRREMVLDGYTRDAPAKAKLDGGLRDPRHTMVPKTTEDRRDEKYKVSFSSSVNLKPSSSRKHE